MKVERTDVIDDEVLADRAVGYFVEENRAGEEQCLAEHVLATTNLIYAVMLGKAGHGEFPMTHKTINDAINGYGDWLLATRSEADLQKGHSACLYRLTIERIGKPNATADEQKQLDALPQGDDEDDEEG